MEADGALFIVDGIGLSLDDIKRFAQTHEEWQFSLRFADPSDALLES